MESAEKLHEAIRVLEAAIEDPHAGLPQEVFLFATRIIPMINVDLLIQDDSGRTLLTWREERYWKPGWHVPGGIIRYKETFADRVRAVARLELGAEVSFPQDPIAINQLIQTVRRDRGHFISLLFPCRLLTQPDPALRAGAGAPLPNQWRWHERCPGDLLGVHEIYRRYLEPGAAKETPEPRPQGGPVSTAVS